MKRPEELHDCAPVTPGSLSARARGESPIVWATGGPRRLAVAAKRDDDGGLDRGAVWILFLYADGTVKSHQKISDTQGNFTGTLDDSDLFGESVASLGDLDGDGVGDLAVGEARGPLHGLPAAIGGGIRPAPRCHWVRE